MKRPWAFAGFQPAPLFAAPRVRGSCPTVDLAVDITLSGNMAYVPVWNYGLQIIDVTNPAAPVHIGSSPYPTPAANLVVSDGRAYIACWETGLRLVDVTNPSKPLPLASYDTPGRAIRVAVRGDLVYLTDSDGGFYILGVGVVDTTAPVITLLGDNPMTLEVGTPYAEPGYTAMDNFDGDITGKVLVTGSVDDKVVGTYVLAYEVTDKAGNRALALSTVKVADTTPPVITLLGDNPMALECGTPYLEPGYMATDNYDGDITANVAMSGWVDGTVLGTYVMRYNVSDSSGNPAEEKARTVNVVERTPFQTAEIAETAEAMFRLTWASRPGATYCLWSCSDLLAGVMG